MRLGPGPAPLPVHDGPGGDDPCGALLLGGAGDQRPFDAFAVAPGRHVVIGRERALDDDTPWRVFAMGFDDRGQPLFPDVIATPADPLARGDYPFGAPDGAGGFFLGWVEVPPFTTLQGRVMVARFDGAGTMLWPAPVVVSTGPLAMSSDSAAVADGRGGVFVTWLEPFPGDPDGYQPRIQHLDPGGRIGLGGGGARVDPARRISGPVLLAPWGPPAAGAGAGAVALAISEVPRAHLVMADGGRPWGAAGVALMPGLAGLRPADIGFAAAPDGTLRVTWIETDGFMLDRLMARRLDPDGRMPWPEPVALLETQLLLQRSERVLGDGTLVAAAAVYVPDLPAGPADVVAQAVDARGRPRVGLAGLDLGRADRRQWNPILLTAPGVPPSVLWSDARPGTGVDGADAYFAQSMAPSTAPRLQSPSAPLDLRQGGDRIIGLDGDDLDPGLGASAGPGIEVAWLSVEPLSADGPGDRLLLGLRALPHAAVGPHALRVVNPDGGSAEAPALLRVGLDPSRVDIDDSGRADGFDLALLAASFGRAAGDPGYATPADIDGSGLVDGLDLALLAGRFGDSVRRAE